MWWQSAAVGDKVVAIAQPQNARKRTRNGWTEAPFTWLELGKVYTIKGIAADKGVDGYDAAFFDVGVKDENGGRTEFGARLFKPIQRSTEPGMKVLRRIIERVPVD